MDVRQGLTINSTRKSTYQTPWSISQWNLISAVAPATYANRLRIQLLIARREGPRVWRGTRPVCSNAARESSVALRDFRDEMTWHLLNVWKDRKGKKRRRFHHERRAISITQIFIPLPPPRGEISTESAQRSFHQKSFLLLPIHFRNKEQKDAAGNKFIRCLPPTFFSLSSSCTITTVPRGRMETEAGSPEASRKRH